ncbi:MAG: ester cyclase [Acidobacteriota bacterium]|nr:ester cyclase [Acidobacteriota bacterium]
MSALQITEFEQIWVDGLNRGDVSAANEAFTADSIIHINGNPKPSLSLAEFKEMAKGLLASFPDLHFTIEDQVVSDDKVTTRWVAEGTNTGPLGDIPATGKGVRINGLILDKVVGDKVAERWEQWDQAGMMQQLGLI